MLDRLVAPLTALDPRRSLAAAVGWLVFWLGLALGGLTGSMAGEYTRDAMLDQRRERAANAAQQWSDGLENLLAQRQQPIRTAAAMVPPAIGSRDIPRLAAVFEDLHSAYPELAWIELAGTDGAVLTSIPSTDASNASERPWFREGLKGSWTGAVDRTGSGTPSLIALAWPVRDVEGRPIGVVGAHLSMDWLRRAAAELRAHVPMLGAGAYALVIDSSDRVVMGPASMLGQPAPKPNGQIVQTEARPGERLHALGWRVQLTWPLVDVTRRANADRRTIALMALVIGGVVTAFGVALASRLTQRLTALSRAVEAIDPRASEALVVPPGRDEVSHLGGAFNALLGSLQGERNALSELSAELESRVQTRTRQVEALAGEARYAAVVRERLRIARDLHDTLAHSMMAMLAEMRILKTLHAHEPAALGAELERAEAAAREGLERARAAITQMRFNAVRDIGLGPALKEAAARFAERSGLEVDYRGDPRAASFAERRAETVFRIAEEALRNVERHASAKKVWVALEDVGDSSIELTVRDDGAGFDPALPRPGHFGIVGLKEQAQLIDATLAIDSRPGQGTSLTLRLRSEPDLQA